MRILCISIVSISIARYLHSFHYPKIKVFNYLEILGDEDL